MKKLLVLALVLSVASLASAGISLSLLMARASRSFTADGLLMVTMLGHSALLPRRGMDGGCTCFGCSWRY